MEDKELEQLFKELKGRFDVARPIEGHTERFEARLQGRATHQGLDQGRKWSWKWAAVAAVLVGVGLGLYLQGTGVQDPRQGALSPEIQRTQFHFAGLVQEQVTAIRQKSSPATERMIADVLQQLEHLEADYAHLEQELVQGGNSKLLLRAMITNYQTRLALLQDVLERMEMVNQIKTMHHEDPIL
ncbi:hypothetical protein [Maribacter sp. 2307ULW6-5]|uniref:hypothetical protein n=1 Tax=Maribacter sp. 2307ULW6-5 TaxID=3386275 RepID=UPI0039BC4607